MVNESAKILADSGRKIWVFFGSDLSTHPCYTVFDPVAKTWSKETPVLEISSSMPNRVVPRAVLYRGDIYLFACSQGPLTLVTRLHKGDWSTATSLQTEWLGASCTPHVLNDELYMFYIGLGSPNRISCLQVLDDFSVAGPWTSEPCSPQFPVGVSDRGVLYYNNNGGLETMLFDSAAKKFGSAAPIVGGRLSFGPSVVTTSGQDELFYKGPGADTQLYVGDVVKGVYTSAGPSAVLLDEAEDHADFAVFYKDAEIPARLKNLLKMSVVRAGEEAITVVDTSDSGCLIGMADGGPCAIMVP